MGTAQKKLNTYCKENGIKPDSYIRELHSKATGLDLPKEPDTDDQQERTELWHKISDLVDSIPAAKTIEARKVLQKKLTIALFEYDMANNT